MPQTETVQAAPARRKRIFEIDVLRAVAILLMSTFHLVFDLVAYYGVPLTIYSGVWYWVGRSSAMLFMFVSGISGSFGGRSIRRGFIVLGAALIVTLVSIPTMGPNYIRFGILHFFAVVMIVKGLFDLVVKNYWARILTASVLVPVSLWLGDVVQKTTVRTPLLLPLGLTYPGFTSFDYYPLFPWAAYFCLGIVAGMLVYKNRQSLFAFDITQPQPTAGKRLLRAVLRPLAFLGRHSLLVYLLHQPLILGVLFLLSLAGLF